MRSIFHKSFLILFLSAFACRGVDAQIISTSPIFPTRNSTVTVTYDAGQGNAALVGTNPVYAHTGLITSRSGSAPAVWQYTQGNWGTADSRVLMTSLGGNKWQITYNIASFYGDNLSDTINKMAFVFRNANGSVVGRTALGGDIYTNVYNDSLHCAFINPTSGSVVQKSLMSTMNFFCAASQNCTLTLYANGNQLAQVTNDSLFYNNFTFLNYGNYHFVLTADNGTQHTADSMDVLVNPAIIQQDPSSGTVEGINYINDSTVILELLAPYKNFVYVIGDFNNWQLDTNYLMKQSLNGQLWWAQITHLTPQKEYIFQYDVDGSIRIGDPYCDKVSDPGNDVYIPTSTYPNMLHYPTGKTYGIASVLQTAQIPYQWGDTTYRRPNKHNLVIYEMLVRDFQSLNNYSKLTDSLNYLQTLGINAIELMPIMNFEGTSSWGYDPNYYLAPTKSYGNKASLKRFIDACHQRGIAVILDIALNDAFASCPMAMLYWDPVNQYPAANNPWFNQLAPHPYSVGYDFNHNSLYTQNFVDRTTKYWIQDYHVDGYRFDLAKGYTQTYSGGDVGAWGSYDTMRIRLIERMADHIWNNVDSASILILEYFANNAEQIELQRHNKGLMLWGFDLNPAYNQCTMGYNSNADISQVSYQYDGWNNANLVGYMESHDEERLMYKNLMYGDSTATYNAKSLDTALARIECAGALFFPVPGPKMIWQFEERGYDISINYNGRINPKPSHWDYMRNRNRLHLYKVWSAMIKLKLNYPTFSTTNYNVDMSGVVKKIWLVSPGGGAFNAQVIGNFDVVSQTAPPYFQHTGWWYDYLSGDSFNVTNANMTITLKPGEYHIYTDQALPKPDLTIPALPNGIEDISVYTNDKIAVYPVPAQDQINFMSEDGKPIQKVSVYDLSGRLIFDREFDGDQPLVSLNLSADVNSGMYIYTATVNKIIHTGKLIINK